MVAKTEARAELGAHKHGGYITAYFETCTKIRRQGVVAVLFSFLMKLFYTRFWLEERAMALTERFSREVTDQGEGKAAAIQSSFSCTHLEPSFRMQRDHVPSTNLESVTCPALKCSIPRNAEVCVC